MKFLKKKSSQSGFTLVELLVVVGIISLLSLLITTNLPNITRQNALNSDVNVVISDLKAQQLKAMDGDMEGRTAPDNYGITITTATTYTLFHGGTFVQTDPSNLAITLDNSLQFVEVGESIIFNRLDGSVVGFNPLANTITLKDAISGIQKVITFNRYGVISSVN